MMDAPRLADSGGRRLEDDGARHERGCPGGAHREPAAAHPAPAHAHRASAAVPLRPHRALFLILAILSSAPEPAGAEDPPYRMQAVHADSSFLRFPAADVWGYADVNGEYALVCAGSSLKVIDVTDPSRPVLASEVRSVSSALEDVKTYKHYAYCVNRFGPLQVVDLSDPYHAFTAATFRSATVPGARNVWVSDNGYAYLALDGVGDGDFRILDLADPLRPVERGHYAHRAQGEPTTCRDVYVRNDTCFAPWFNEGFVILDVRNKDYPGPFATVSYPHQATHSAWPTVDGGYLCTTDDMSGGPMRVWRMNGFSITQVAEYETLAPATIHNVRVKGPYAYISYHTAGVRIVDLDDPGDPIEVGRFDTNRLSGGGAGGCWGVYPFAPSGLIYASDIENGLFVLRYLDGREGVVRGRIRVRDAGAVPVAGAEVRFQEAEVRAVSDPTGFFRATVYAGTHTVRVSAPGFAPETFTATLAADGVVTHDLVLEPVPGPPEFPEEPAPPLALADGRLTFEARVRAHGSPIAGVTLHYRSGGTGSFREVPMRRASPDDELYVGYVPAQLPGTLVQYFFGAEDQAAANVFAPADAPAASFDYQVGEIEWTTVFATDLEDDAAGFSVGSPDDRGDRGVWEWVALVEVPDSLHIYGRPTQPEEDATRRPGSGQGQCFLTELGDPEARPEEHSVIGRTTLTSPVFDLTGATAARLVLALWYVNDLGPGSARQDPFLIEGSSDGGASWIVLEAIRVIDPGWQTLTVDLGHRLDFAASARVRFVAEDAISPSLVEAAIDDIRIETTVGIGTGDTVGSPPTILFRQNTPNPFNPSTAITYQLKEERPVRLAIYNGAGRLVRVLVDQVQGVGDHEAVWDGRNEVGRPVASGVYFYRLESREFNESRKMLLAR